MAHKERMRFIGAFVFVVGSVLVLSLTVTGVAAAQNPVPLINEPLVPDTVKPGSPGFVLTVNGTGFVSGATVHWNGSTLATTFVSRSRLKASVPASDIAIAGTASVTVVNPTPGGGASNTVFFPIAALSSTIAMSESTTPSTSSKLPSLARLPAA